MPVTSRRPFLPALHWAGGQRRLFCKQSKIKSLSSIFSFRMKAKQDKAIPIFLSTIFLNVPKCFFFNCAHVHSLLLYIWCPYIVILPHLFLSAKTVSKILISLSAVHNLLKQLISFEKSANLIFSTVRHIQIVFVSVWLIDSEHPYLSVPRYSPYAKAFFEELFV